MKTSPHSALISNNYPLLLVKTPIQKVQLYYYDPESFLRQLLAGIDSEVEVCG